MKKLLLLICLAFYTLAVSAQTTMRVDVPNVVAADEQFSVTFIIEGDENPKDYHHHKRVEHGAMEMTSSLYGGLSRAVPRVCR